MVKNLIVVLLLLVSCGGETATPDGGAGHPGHITTNTTWSGTTQITTNTIIDPGITVTVAAGASIKVKAGMSITIAGTLDIAGTTASKVTIDPDGVVGFGGLQIPTGGTLTMRHTVMTGGQIVTNGSAHATILDSQLSHVQGDLLIMNGGILDVEYSAIGREPGLLDTTHCDMHFGGAGNVAKVTHSNISTSAYGLMFYSGNSADLTFCNWFSNTTSDVDTQLGNPVSGSFSSGWFEKGPPTAANGSSLTLTGLASTRLPICTGANDATCAGVRP